MKKDSPASSETKKHWRNKLDLVNGKPIPFADRGVSELSASVLVPRGICPDLLGEQCWDQKQLCTTSRKQFPSVSGSVMRVLHKKLILVMLQHLLSSPVS